jgi:hypothetical protein
VPQQAALHDAQQATSTSPGTGTDDFTDAESRSAVRNIRTTAMTQEEIFAEATSVSRLEDHLHVEAPQS